MNNDFIHLYATIRFLVSDSNSSDFCNADTRIWDRAFRSCTSVIAMNFNRANCAKFSFPVLKMKNGKINNVEENESRRKKERRKGRVDERKCDERD